MPLSPLNHCSKRLVAQCVITGSEVNTRAWLCFRGADWRQASGWAIHRVSCKHRASYRVILGPNCKRQATEQNIIGFTLRYGQICGEHHWPSSACCELQAGAGGGWLGPDRVSSSEVQRWELDVVNWVSFLPTLSWGMKRDVLVSGTPGSSFSRAPNLENIWGWFSLPSPPPSSLRSTWHRAFFLTRGSALFGQEARRAPRGWARSRPV